jgi:hypothetical protein
VERGGNTFLVIRAVRREQGHWCHHLVEQGANLKLVIDVVGGQRRRDNLASLGVYADVQLPPGPTRFGAMLLQQPLACAMSTRPAGPPAGFMQQRHANRHLVENLKARLKEWRAMAIRYEKIA